MKLQKQAEFGCCNWVQRRVKRASVVAKAQSAKNGQAPTLWLGEHNISMQVKESEAKSSQTTS